jgi:tetratricopeptide (TPR) repeat protein
MLGKAAPSLLLLAHVLVPTSLAAQLFEPLERGGVRVDVRLLAYLDIEPMGRDDVVPRAASLCVAAGYSHLELVLPDLQSTSGSEPRTRREVAEPVVVLFYVEAVPHALPCRSRVNPALVARLIPKIPWGGGESATALAVLGHATATSTEQAENALWDAAWRLFRRVASPCIEQGYRFAELPTFLPSPGAGWGDFEEGVPRITGELIRFEVFFHHRAGPWHLECDRLDELDRGATLEYVRPEVGYERLLRSWADGYRQAADVLFDFRVRLGMEGSSRCIEDLEQRIAETLLQHDPGALLAFTELHAWVWYRVHDSGRPVEADRLLDRIDDWLAEAVAAGGPDEARFASDLLGYYGGLSSRVRSEERQYAALGLLERSLEHDPSNGDAGLVLVHVHEILGETMRALRAAAAVLERYPEHPEARLRLAVNLGRDAPRRAIDPLTAVARGDAPIEHEWMRRIAYGELARLARERDDLDEAIRLLEEARGALGPSEDLVIQLAFVEGHRERREGRRRFDTGRLSWVLDDFSEPRGLTARMRYDQGPVDSMDALVARIDRAVSETRPRLGAILDELARLDRIGFGTVPDGGPSARRRSLRALRTPRCEGIVMQVLMP